MFSWQAFTDDVLFSFKKHKAMAEKAFSQMDDDAFFRKPAAESNSVAIIVKHVAGNLLSRWTEFLTSDGEKTWRERDGEFLIGDADTRAALLATWEKAWDALLQTLATLQERDSQKVITIRGETHTVLQAIQRSLTHTTYHVGQIVYLAKMLKNEGWEWITIPPGQSKQTHKTYLK